MNEALGHCENKSFSFGVNCKNLLIYLISIYKNKKEDTPILLVNVNSVSIIANYHIINLAISLQSNFGR